MANFLFRTIYEVSYKLSESIFRFQTAKEKYISSSINCLIANKKRICDTVELP
jgi:hypothetical protein